MILQFFVLQINGMLKRLGTGEIHRELIIRRRGRTRLGGKSRHRTEQRADAYENEWFAVRSHRLIICLATSRMEIASWRHVLGEPHCYWLAGAWSNRK